MRQEMARMREQDLDVPRNYPGRVLAVRTRLGLTQTQLAQRIGVSFTTINRWENGQSQPTRLAWQQIVDLEAGMVGSVAASAPPLVPAELGLDFAGKPEVVGAVAEATRLTYGHLFNPAFATEISLIDPLPHQRIAVYEHMLGLSPLRFLLADDAGAGKTIMTGLYLREVFARRLIKRVLVVPPAGLVGNWEREMRTLFRLSFRIVRGADARIGNPFVGPDSDRLIISVDTLAGERMFARLREAVASGAALPYDLVVFDEAHKLAADREQDFYVRKTDRYRLAEAIAGLPPDDPRWDLGWSATNLLLLTATPHMGKDFPYYCLWRLLAPDALATFDAFKAFPEAQRRKHFIRRTKEEMVRFDGQPLYPQRQCDTLSYDLSPAEQELYVATTAYINETYNKARILNRSAARLAMSVFQRRQASSTYALLRSFERRLEKLDDAIELVRAGRGEELERRQKRIGDTPDFFETRTADEDADETGERERHEEFEESALGGVVALTLMELQEERGEVETLLAQARHLADVGEDSKFEKLRAVLRDPRFAREKFIIFTEHRDTAEILVRRLEGLGFTGQVALIHGGLDYRAREAQVELFRRPLDEGGANYLVATDAAGEGINLQFCWLMVNYDVPWNPARLEQRMGRIHRYGQKHDPVVIVNLLAGQTREGRVIKKLLEKLELIRKQLRSDKVFDVVGRLFENVSLKSYLEMATTEEGERAAIEGIDGLLTDEQVRALEARDQALFGGGDVKSHLAELNIAMEQEQYRRLLPGYIRRFVGSAAPLIDLRVDGDLDGGFELAPERPRAFDPVLSAMEFYPAEMQGRFTVYRPKERGDAIWLHPGEPVFDRFCATLLTRHGDAAQRGAIFIDPHATAPYLFHLAQVSVVRRHADVDTGDLVGKRDDRHTALPPEVIESRLIGLRQESDGAISLCPIEHLLLLHGARNIAPGSVPLARLARGLTEAAGDWINNEALSRIVGEQRAKIELSLPERLDWLTRGYDHKTAELIAKRQRVTEEARKDDPRAKAELTKVKGQQRQLAADKDRRLALLKAEPSLIVPGEMMMVAHALVLPTDDPEERQRYDAEVEAVAMRLARVHEEAAGATVHDVSRPELARRAGLTDWPGFDLHSLRPASVQERAEDRAIEVKGCARSGGVEVSANEWAKACNLRDRYWLYVVFDCATPKPRLVRVRDPFGRLLARAKGSVLIQAGQIISAAEEA
jgi:superfamily II DNA or RNA helicase/DNA-binding XRE family transcriptional regulator